MVVKLVPVNIAESKFKYLRKMSLQGVGDLHGAGDLSSISTRPNTVLPIQDATDVTKNQYLKDFIVNKAIQSDLSTSINEKIATHLSREIIDILQDTEINDDVKAANYLQAIKRYLTYRGKLYPITPVTSTKTGYHIVDGVSPDERYISKFYQPDQRETIQAKRKKMTTAQSILNGDEHMDLKYLFDEQQPDQGPDVTNYRQLSQKTILDYIFPAGKKRAANLLKKIYTVPDHRFGWNKHGEILIDGKRNKGTSIKSIINNCLLKAPKKRLTGFQDTVELLFNEGAIKEPVRNHLIGKRKRQRESGPIENWNV